MTAHQQIGVELFQVVGCVEIPLLENRTVAGDDRFVTVLVRVGRVAEDVVAGRWSSGTARPARL